MANDLDYMQILDDNIHLYNLKNKNLRNKSIGSSKQDLIIKIIMGDKSDNISACFPRCGKKRALYYSTRLDEMFNKYPDSESKYIKNKHLIDFDEIPKELKYKIITKFEKIFM